jgi:hydrogenase maturation protease
MKEPSASRENKLNILVLGVGNILLSDEGVGIRVVERLLARYLLPPEVEVIDGGTMGLDLLGYFQDRSHVLLIDAVKSGRPAGTVSRLELTDPSAHFRTRISPHQIGLSDVLAIAAVTDGLPPHMVLFGIEPARLDTGLELSPEAAASLDPLTGMVAQELAALDIILEPRPAGEPACSSFPIAGPVPPFDRGPWGI